MSPGAAEVIKICLGQTVSKITFLWLLFDYNKIPVKCTIIKQDLLGHRLRTPKEEMAFTARPKIQSQSKFLGTAETYFVCHIGPIF